MKRQLIIYSITFIICSLSYSQDNTNNFKYSIGGIASNYGFDHGLTILKFFNKNSISFSFQQSKRVYGVGMDIFSEWQLKPGTTNGYDIGINYNYLIKQKNYYRSFLKIGYSYKNIKGNNFSDGYQLYSYTFDLTQKHHSIKFGYVNSFTINRFEINLTPIIHMLHYENHNFNYVVYGDGEKNNQDLIGYGLRFDIEVAILYCFIKNN